MLGVSWVCVSPQDLSTWLALASLQHGGLRVVDLNCVSGLQETRSGRGQSMKSCALKLAQSPSFTLLIKAVAEPTQTERKGHRLHFFFKLINLKLKYS